MKEGALDTPRRRRPKAGMSGQNGEAGLAEAYYSKTIGRALDVLECFPDQGAALGLQELSRATRLPNASLFRILLTLESRGYLDRNPDGAYQLSRKVTLGRQWERAAKLARLVRPELQKLAARFNETASLAYLFVERIQVLDTVESFHEMRLANKVGRVLPPHCSALGKAIAAFQYPARIDQILEVYGLFRRTEHTLVDRDGLLADFAVIRTRGYALDREESVLGGICVGVPIRSAPGSVSAALSISVPKARMGTDKEQAIAHALQSASQSIAEAAAETAST